MSIMWRRVLLTGLATLTILLSLCVIWAISVEAPKYMVGVHQRGVTRELAEWKTGYCNISSAHDAVRTAEMLRYVQWYYTPSDGYRSTPEIEARLQSQRQDTITSLITALRKYTSEDFGADSDKWLAYLRANATQPGAASEPPD